MIYWICHQNPCWYDRIMLWHNCPSCLLDYLVFYSLTQLTWYLSIFYNKRILEIWRVSQYALQKWSHNKNGNFWPSLPPLPLSRYSITPPSLPRHKSNSDNQLANRFFCRMKYTFEVAIIHNSDWRAWYNSPKLHCSWQDIIEYIIHESHRLLSNTSKIWWSYPLMHFSLIFTKL